MSKQAQDWARQLFLPSSEKTLILILSDLANEDRGQECWPSHDLLRKRTGQNRKTIIRVLMRLQRRGLIIDTGKRTGKSGRIKIYRINLHMSVSGEGVDAGLSPNPTVFGSLSGTVNAPNLGTPIVPKTDADSPQFSPGQSQNRDAEPLPNPHSTLKEPKRGCFASGVGNTGYRSIEFYLDDNDREKISIVAPGRDKHELFRLFDRYFADKGEIRNPPKAFFGWLRKFIVGEARTNYASQLGGSYGKRKSSPDYTESTDDD